MPPPIAPRAARRAALFRNVRGSLFGERFPAWPENGWLGELSSADIRFTDVGAGTTAFPGFAAPPCLPLEAERAALGAVAAADADGVLGV